MSRQAEQGRRSDARSEQQKETALPDYVLIPILLVILAVGIVALIYWGGFVEERRNN